MKSSRTVLALRVLGFTLLVVGAADVRIRLDQVGSENETYNDFTADYLAGVAWSQGDSPYAKTRPYYVEEFGSKVATGAYTSPSFRNPHTPLHILLARPLAELSYASARRIWIVTTVGFTLAAFYLFSRGLGIKRFDAAVIGAATLGLPIVQSNTVYGHVNGLLLFLLVMSWNALRAGRPVRAGVVLGIGVALRLFPLLLILPLARLRQRTAIIVTVVTGLALFLISGAVAGPRETMNFLTTVSPANVNMWQTTAWNFSPLSLPYRVLDGAWAEVARVLIASALFVGLVRTRARFSTDIFWSSIPWILLLNPLLWDTQLVLVVPLFIGSIAITRRPPTIPLAVAAAVIVVGSAGVGSSAQRPAIDFLFQVLLLLPLAALAYVSIADAIDTRREPGVMRK